MSAPNKTYDPVEVAVLAPEEVQRMQADALAAIDAAADLDELKAARLAHAGRPRADHAGQRRDRRAAARRPRRGRQARRHGPGRDPRRRWRQRQAELEDERDQRVLVEEAVDVTLPWDRTAQGARHPVTTVGERLADVFVNMGYEIAEGPEVEAEWYNFDALNFPPDHPAREMQDTIFVEGAATQARSAPA